MSPFWDFYHSFMDESKVKKLISILSSRVQSLISKDDRITLSHVEGAKDNFLLRKAFLHPDSNIRSPIDSKALNSQP